MKEIWLLTKTNIRRNIIAIVLSVFAGLILSFLIYGMGNLILDVFSAKIRLGIIDHDNSILSSDFKRYLTEELQYDLFEDYTYSELSTELIVKKISAIIEIPEDFYSMASRGVISEFTITTLDDFENIAFMEAYLNSYLSSIQIMAMSTADNSMLFDEFLRGYQERAVEITQEAAVVIDRKELGDRFGFINSIGFFLMIVFAVSAILAYMIMDDRLSGIYSRIQVTPVKPAQYIIGSAILGMMIGMIMVVIYCGYIKIANITTGVSFGLLVMIMTMFTLFTVCFSIAVALFLNSRNAVTGIIIGYSTIGCILGGAYFPLDMSPQSLQNLAKILPQFWFMDLFRTIQADPLANIYPHIIILTLFTLLSFLVAAVLFSQNYKKN